MKSRVLLLTLWLYAGVASAQELDTTWSLIETVGLRSYASLEYLLWWMKPVCLKVPTLSSGDPNDAVPGAFGQPGTRLLAGGSRFEFPGASGFRPRVGFFLSTDDSLAIEVEGFLLETAVSHQNVRVPGGEFGYLPYVSPTASNAALPFSIPGVVDGAVFATGSSRLWGAEANAIANLLSRDFGQRRLQGGVLAGFRYLDLTDRIRLVNVQALAGDPTQSTFGAASLTTMNQFYGVQVGQRLALSGPRGSIEAVGKLAIGETNLASEFEGNPLARPAIAPGLVPGPLQVLPSNTGYHSTYRVTLVPEIGTKMRWTPTERFSMSLGYSLIYWNRILCPGDLMDPRVNPTQLPGRGPETGPRLPALQALHTDYFTHGINAGFELKF